jgi:hypothetical protein
MKPFTQFLKEQALHDPRNQVERKRREWVSSVERLMTQAREWLEESDRETKILRLVVDDSNSIEEQEFGRYHVPSLQIGLGGKVVEMRPVARNVDGGIHEGELYFQAQGRVDISDRVRNFIVYRIKKEHGQDRWTVVDPDRDIVTELDRSTFEAIVQSLLE